ncbi:alanine-glyoxylate aminotransferase, putative [Ixodes scapularis]|uniref:Alanine-glyoxylate aminotransferase, putative n=1 Tax=Ixodes scapularis TaxID=6945 RepID=B7PSK7_IXOSC|nr:alanine-glyoxylate aminotransferase, putative [Ixodes scapularis]|eukprot:XP_002402705.1 alanine-glyoxylate aminotransferase, putative [Ixodes scapularis]
MYDECGNEYLDCINNVAHVGHCHPHVVKAGAEQMSQLSTNSRYLHDNLVLYAQRLTNYFPNKLSVCYFYVCFASSKHSLHVRDTSHVANRCNVSCDMCMYIFFVNLFIVLDLFYFTAFKCMRQKCLHNVATCTRQGQRSHWVPLLSLPFFSVPYLSLLFSLLHVISQCRGEEREDENAAFGLPLAKLFSLVKVFFKLIFPNCLKLFFFSVSFLRIYFSLNAWPVFFTYMFCGKTKAEGLSKAFNEAALVFPMQYGGNPVSVAIAAAVLDVIENEKLQQHAEDVGNYLINSLKELQQRHQLIGDVRQVEIFMGHGLFVGVELVLDRNTREPATEEASLLSLRLKEQRVLLSTEGRYGNVLKFKPPMVFTRANVDSVVEKLDVHLRKIEEQLGMSFRFENIADALTSSVESLSTASSLDSLEESSEEDLSSSS